ncbi:MAG: hypothetical protein WD060_03885 [Pirellulales bacterium]
MLLPAALAHGQEYVVSDHGVDASSPVAATHPGGGFESVLIDNVTTSVAEDNSGDEHDTAWSTTGNVLDQAWDSCTEALEVTSTAQCRDCGQTHLACCLSGCGGPRWCAQVDGLALWQGNIPSEPFLLAPNGQVALNANQAQTEATPGVRVGLLRRLNERMALEGNYIWAQPFQSYTLVPATSGFYTMTNLADLTFNDVTTATMTTEAQFQGAEFNGRYCDGGLFTWLAGFRWVQWNQLTSIGYDYAAAEPLPGGVGTIQSRVGNDLYGGQIGGIMKLWNNGGRWQVTGVGKAGLYYNTAWQTTVVTDGRIPVPPNNPVGASGQQTSFVGEVGVNSSLWLTERLAWRLGYTFFWLTDVAVPQAQFPLSNIGNQTAGINTTGSVLLHGVTTGLEARW